MNFDRLIDDFITDYLERGTYASITELREVISEVADLIKSNKDKTSEEIIELLINNNINVVDSVRKDYGIPGYVMQMKVGKINLKLYSGKLNYLGEDMTDDALFDIASMTKFYTQAIIYNLLKENVLAYDDKIRDLDSRFNNLLDLTVGDILTFSTTFEMDKRLDDYRDKEEAIDALTKARVVAKNKYNYNDIGLIIMKEVMEKVSGLRYEELLDKYVLKPLHLTNTHLMVPKEKYHLVTGTPNFKIGKVNDLKALILGGYSGHAGIIASSDDIIKMMTNVHQIVPNIKDAYTPGKYNKAYGIMGNTYVAHPEGLDKSFLDKLETKDSFGIAGSTRVNALASYDSAYDILFNPSSIDENEAIKQEKRINDERVKHGLAPIQIVKKRTYTTNGKNDYTLIDSRYLVPVSAMDKVMHQQAKTMLMLRFFDYVIKCYSNEIKDIEFKRKI